MSKSDVDNSAHEGAEQTEKRVDENRREALKRFGKYTAPAMLALLMSGKAGHAFPPLPISEF